MKWDGEMGWERGCQNILDFVMFNSCILWLRDVEVEIIEDLSNRIFHRCFTEQVLPAIARAQVVPP